MSSTGYPSATLVEQIESLNAVSPPTFMELLDRLYAMRYQGNLTLHFAAGIPRQVVLDQPLRVPLNTKA